MIYILKHAGGKVAQFLLKLAQFPGQTYSQPFSNIVFLKCPCHQPFLAIRAHLVCFCNCMWKLHYVSPGLLHCLPDLNLHLLIELSRGHVDCWWGIIAELDLAKRNTIGGGRRLSILLAKTLNQPCSNPIKIAWKKAFLILSDRTSVWAFRCWI